MNDIKKSVKILLSVKDHQKTVEDFAKNTFHEKFKNDFKNTASGGFQYYKDFTILSETKIRINYCYGAGDMDFTDSFDVDIN